jgi:hypothetical protein
VWQPPAQPRPSGGKQVLVAQTSMLCNSINGALGDLSRGTGGDCMPTLLGSDRSLVDARDKRSAILRDGK